MKRLGILILLLCSSLLAQTHTTVTVEDTQNITGKKIFKAATVLSGNGTTEPAVTVKDSVSGNTAASLTTDSTDHQVTQNYFAPGREYRFSLSAWSAPLGDTTAQRMFSLSAHGINDPYNEGACAGGGCRHVSMYSVDGAGNWPKVFEWNWGDQWSSKWVMYMRDQEWNKDLDDSAHSQVAWFCGGTHECQWILSRVVDPVSGSTVSEWYLRMSPNSSLGWYDKVNETFRAQYMLGGDNIYNVPTSKLHRFRVNGSDVVTIDGNGLSTTSTSLVANLNADKLDGSHATDFTKAVGSATRSIDFPSVANAACSTNYTSTVTGATVGDSCTVDSNTTGLPSSTWFTCQVTANTATYQYCNLSGTAVDRPTDTYIVKVRR